MQRLTINSVISMERSGNASESSAKTLAMSFFLCVLFVRRRLPLLVARRTVPGRESIELAEFILVMSIVFACEMPLVAVKMLLPLDIALWLLLVLLEVVLLLLELLLLPLNWSRRFL